MNFARCLCLVLCLSALPAQAAKVEAAKQFMTGLVDLARTSKSTEGKVSAESSRRVKALSDQIDFAALARKSLGSRWQKFADSERKDFLRTLQELLEVVVYPAAKRIAMGPDGFVYSESADRVGVEGKIEREKNGEVLTQDLEVTLIFGGNGKIADAVIEDEMVSANLKRQFDSALKKESFASIIQKMKKRVVEARK
ncbi:MAG: ABC transporter substrate-binding protein [Bdellovibrionales bacterium]|nr:ABC transporter substrate-binding protein [Bdellovibrionales bacterium]